jgi:hypothetical protein
LRPSGPNTALKLHLVPLGPTATTGPDVAVIKVVMLNQFWIKQIEDLHHRSWDRGGLAGYTVIQFHQDAQQFFVVFTVTKYTQ